MIAMPWVLRLMAVGIFAVMALGMKATSKPEEKPEKDAKK